MRASSKCRTGDREHPCACAMGNVSRFVEPLVLLMLHERGHSYGYELSESLPAYMLTDAPIERAALYRTLRTLECNGHVTSSWEPQSTGPARRIYALTTQGERHLQEWRVLMDGLGDALKQFARRAEKSQSKPRS